MSREIIPSGYCGLATNALVAMTLGAFAVAPAWGQDTQANTSGNQPMNQAGALPPPIPPSPDGAAAVQVNSQAEQTQALDASRNAAFSMQQPNQDQSLVQPQPPAASVVNQVPAGGRPQLGIQMSASEGPGVRVTNVMAGSAAAAAGILPGDYLLAVGSQTVELPIEVSNIIQSHKPGDAVQLRIWRDRADQLVTAKLLELQPVQTRTTTTVNRPVYSESPVVPESNVVGGFAPAPVYQQYYYPGTYGYNYAPYGYRYGWNTPYRGSYYGTPRFGYWNSPWGEGVNVGGFQFGWR